MADVDLNTLTREQLIARLQIAMSQLGQLREANIHLHRMMETLREQGWSTPRPATGGPTIHDYPMGGGDVDRRDLAQKLNAANERADHWRKKYMDLLDSTGRR